MCVVFIQVTAGEERYILGRNLIRPQEGRIVSTVIVLWSDANFLSLHVLSLGDGVLQKELFIL